MDRFLTGRNPALMICSEVAGHMLLGLEPSLAKVAKDGQLKYDSKPSFISVIKSYY